MFQKASKQSVKIRLALSGASGSGKTFSALAIASHLATPIAVIDTERGSASKYADLFQFDVCELNDFNPSRYIEAIKYAEDNGYKTIIIDSLSHAWYWELDTVDNQRNSFTGWKNVRPLERKLIDAIVGSRCHIIGTMRSKTEWVVEPDERGKITPKKVGTTPIQASNIEYEFDIAGELNQQHILTISKSRCSALADKSFLSPGKEVADILKQWIIPTAIATPEKDPPQPWKNWKTEQDAIAWASEQLPQIDETTLKREFSQLTPTNGKKAAAWVDRVMELKEEEF